LCAAFSKAILILILIHDLMNLVCVVVCDAQI